MATQAERRATTRHAIVTAAYEAYEAAGSQDVPLEVIAENAGITKGTIHYHYENRAGLLVAVAVSVFGDLEKRVAVAATDADGRVTTASYIKAILVEQATPTGRVLFTIGDELARIGEFGPVDPHRYLCAQLEQLPVEGSIEMLASSVMHFGRRLAFGLTPIDEIDQIMSWLDIGARIPSAPASPIRNDPSPTQPS